MFVVAPRGQTRGVPNREASSNARSLLIVDDSSEMRRLLRRLCAHAFTDIHECSDGVEAVTAFAAHRPDVVLMDIAMPRQDGLTAMTHIRALSPTARIIILSQHDDASFRQAVAQAGATAFVSKFDLQPLRELLGFTDPAIGAVPSELLRPPFPDAQFK